MPYGRITDMKGAGRDTGPPKACDLIKQVIAVEDIGGIQRNEDGTMDVPFVISSGAVDRDQDTISVDGWDWEAFMQNPVVLFAHDSRRPPIAKALSVFVEDGKLKSVARFMSKALNPFAAGIAEMYANGFMRAVSVGFRSLEARWAPDEDTRPWGVDFLKQELLEYSCVPIPANPDALIDAKDAGIDTGPILEWAKGVLEAMPARAAWTRDGLAPEERRKAFEPDFALTEARIQATRNKMRRYRG